jgi:hypothetical protein
MTERNKNREGISLLRIPNVGAGVLARAAQGKNWRDASRLASKPLQRAQEVEDLLLLGSTQVVEVLFDGRRLAPIAFVSLNYGIQVRGAAIMQEEDSLSKTP